LEKNGEIFLNKPPLGTEILKIFGILRGALGKGLNFKKKRIVLKKKGAFLFEPGGGGGGGGF